MTNLNDIIKQAAKAHAKKSTAPDKETPDWIEIDFIAGVDWATTDPSILQAILQPFLEFISQDEFYKKNFTAEQLIEKYIQFITDKSKEDARQ